jgi:hypothetical protein
MKKLIILTIVATSLFTSCSKSIDEPKKEEDKQTVYFRLSYESKTEKATANNIITAKFK